MGTKACSSGQTLKHMTPVVSHLALAVGRKHACAVGALGSVRVLDNGRGAGRGAVAVLPRVGQLGRVDVSPEAVKKKGGAAVFLTL